MSFVKSINWVDVAILFILIRVIYIGYHRGIITELFKIAGTFVSIFVVLHYFAHLSLVIRQAMNYSQGFGNAIAFLFLWGFSTLVFKIIHDGVMSFFHIDAKATARQIGGLLSAIVRSVLICSLFVVFLRITYVRILFESSQRSLVGSRFVRYAPQIYQNTFNGFIKKFFPTEEINEQAFPYKQI